jgi:hypothetical protein
MSIYYKYFKCIRLFSFKINFYKVEKQNQRDTQRPEFGIDYLFLNISRLLFHLFKELFHVLTADIKNYLHTDQARRERWTLFYILLIIVVMYIVVVVVVLLQSRGLWPLPGAEQQ